MSDLRFRVSADRFHSFLLVSLLYEGNRVLRFLFVSTPEPSFPISRLYTGNGKRSAVIAPKAVPMSLRGLGGLSVVKSDTT